MTDEYPQYQAPDQPGSELHSIREYLVHTTLLVATFFSTALAGVAWLNRNPFELSNLSAGVTYAVLIILMIGTHEFGHYFAARYHGVRTTLPYFLPLPPPLPFSIFGTVGAVIRTRAPIPSRKALFDIGAAGPIAGFVTSLVILIIGFATLPTREYLHTIHPEYAQMAMIPEGGIRFGDTILFLGIAELFAPAGSFIPPMNEVYHYPFLCVGWFGLFVTGLNLIPIGQLDGGHISHAMFGERSQGISLTSLAILTVLGLGGLPSLAGQAPWFGWVGWLLIASVHGVLLYGFRMGQPRLQDETPLDSTRRLIGWICYGILVSSVSVVPLSFSTVDLIM